MFQAAISLCLVSLAQTLKSIACHTLIPKPDVEKYFKESAERFFSICEICV
ncbi:hypothetical protein THF1A12_360015 [Vibrio jasicida]|uniref:Uncharacterized protein n=1 Tax=Vibrio jasicida TaxID=766224 RepID=A0AAU9QQ38_9VIBR|nr:hypothetical protein THF1A12_360015 [Vibrio jasicida]